MSNHKKISKKISVSKHYELKNLEKRNFFLRLENAHLKAQIAMIQSQLYKTDYPSGVPDHLNKKNNYKIAGEIGEPEILSKFNGEIIQGRNKSIDFGRFRSGVASRLKLIDQKEIIIVGDNYPLLENHVDWAWRNNIPEILKQMKISNELFRETTKGSERNF